MTQSSNASDALVAGIAADPVRLAIGSKTRLDMAVLMGVNVDAVTADHDAVLASLTEEQLARYNAHVAGI